MSSSDGDEYEQWLERNYDELNIMWHERGCQYELDAKWDEFCEYEFDIYEGKDI
jgi:hypothetical protein